MLWGGSPAVFDVRYETTPMGAVETMMLDCAYSEIGERLGLPTQGYIALCDAKLLDAQAGLETAMGATLAALAGINSVSGPGMLDFESCQSLEKLVVDNEICGWRCGCCAASSRGTISRPRRFRELLREKHLLIAITRGGGCGTRSLPRPGDRSRNQSRWQEEGGSRSASARVARWRGWSAAAGRRGSPGKCPARADRAHGGGGAARRAWTGSRSSPREVADALDAAEVYAGRGVVRARMGFPDGDSLSAAHAALVDQARAAFRRLARPAGRGQGHRPRTRSRGLRRRGAQRARTPLGGIHPRAEALALFVATLGEDGQRGDRATCSRGQSALAYVLDTVASAAADARPTGRRARHRDGPAPRHGAARLARAALQSRLLRLARERPGALFAAAPGRRSG